MNDPRESKRFKPSVWSQRLVPFLLVILLFGLIAVVILVGLSILGLVPGV